MSYSAFCCSQRGVEEVERRLHALDVRMAKLQTLELRVAKLEDSLDCGHRDMEAGRDANEGTFGE